MILDGKTCSSTSHRRAIMIGCVLSSCASVTTTLLAVLALLARVSPFFTGRIPVHSATGPPADEAAGA